MMETTSDTYNERAQGDTQLPTRHQCKLAKMRAASTPLSFVYVARLTVSILNAIYFALTKIAFSFDANRRFSAHQFL